MTLSFDVDTLLGMMLLSLVGSLIYSIKGVPARLWDLALKQFTVSVELLSSDPAYSEAIRWLADSKYATSARRLQLESHCVEAEDTSWVLSPGTGNHLIKRGLRSVLVTRTCEEAGALAQPKERLTLRMFGRDQEGVRELIKEIQFRLGGDGAVSVYTWHGWWKRIMRKRMRALNTVVLKDGTVESLLADMQRFIASAEWYAHRGIPYRRGYLFCGAPGTGKTSLVQALAGELGRPLALLNLGSVSGDEGLMAAVLAAPKDAIVLLEDVDCAHASGKREPREPSGPGMLEVEGATKGVSLAGLLNALDGVATPDGQIFVMTTNHPEKLDPALMRPGRADVRTTLTLVGAAEVWAMAKRFYGDTVSCPRGLPSSISPAAIQEAFMRHPDDLSAAIQLLKKTQDGPWR